MEIDIQKKLECDGFVKILPKKNLKVSPKNKFEGYVGKLGDK
jgi:hypothetical protein